jgi:hypothetical protein
MTQKFDAVRIDNRQKAGWKVVNNLERIGYSVIHLEKSGTNDFDVVLNSTGIGKLDSNKSEEFLKKIAEDIEKNAMIQPTFVLPPVKTGGEKLLRDVAIRVIEKYFGSPNVRITTM